ncbi:GNAT family N-acetyltransferase [Rhizobium sp. AU243]|uniref:GNAT family N-acetyltransferase n=1 Tax=Rhizobium sp. AU243 TaxID=2303425 RepID=UPI0010CBF6D1|nr:GNAT family N-acetyltransferase [Rhizobium sp. AU243]TKV70484.1 GNAT family N-acetyltransferase [Rhizobium sp. AU243]
MVTLRIDPFPPQDDLNVLWLEAWGNEGPKDFSGVLARSLAHIAAYDDDRLVGFVNVAWDGGAHAFILDTCVIPGMRRRGIAARMVVEATNVARARGASWLHVDFEPHLSSFYHSCGFRPTRSGLIKLR